MGDSLIPGGPGLVNKLEESRPSRTIWRNGCLVLPDETWICPGHGDDTTSAANARISQSGASAAGEVQPSVPSCRRTAPAPPGLGRVRASTTRPPTASLLNAVLVLLNLRHCYTGELAFYRCYSPEPGLLRELVGRAGRRWTVEESAAPELDHDPQREQS